RRKYGLSGMSTLMVTNAQPFIRLRHQDKNMQVQIETEEEDRFVITVGAAIQACKAFGHHEEFTRQFRKLQTKVSTWVKDHEQEIMDAYLTVRDSAILFLVVQKSAAFNEALENSLTEMYVAIAQDAEL